jgi:hypothetical protein
MYFKASDLCLVNTTKRTHWVCNSQRSFSSCRFKCWTNLCSIGISQPLTQLQCRYNVEIPRVSLPNHRAKWDFRTDRWELELSLSATPTAADSESVTVLAVCCSISKPGYPSHHVKIMIMMIMIQVFNHVTGSHQWHNDVIGISLSDHPHDDKGYFPQAQWLVSFMIIFNSSYDMKPWPFRKAYRKWCISKCNMKGSHLNLTQMRL